MLDREEIIGATALAVGVVTHGVILLQNIVIGAYSLWRDHINITIWKSVRLDRDEAGTA